MYAGGRPLWQLSIAVQSRRGPAQVLRWSPTDYRRVEAAKDRIMGMCGTDERVIEAAGEELSMLSVTRQWRKPLSFAEVSQMAPTPEVRARPGRP